MNINSLASVLDNLFADRLYEILKIDIIRYSEATEVEAQTVLDQWAAAGYLRIIRPLVECADMEPCIRLHGFILPNPNRDK